jgi:hypothetical protein
VCLTAFCLLRCILCTTVVQDVSWFFLHAAVHQRVELDASGPVPSTDISGATLPELAALGPDDSRHGAVERPQHTIAHTPPPLQGQPSPSPTPAGSTSLTSKYGAAVLQLGGANFFGEHEQQVCGAKTYTWYTAVSATATPEQYITPRSVVRTHAAPKKEYPIVGVGVVHTASSSSPPSVIILAYDKTTRKCCTIEFNSIAKVLVADRT